MHKYTIVQKFKCTKGYVITDEFNTEVIEEYFYYNNNDIFTSTYDNSVTMHDGWYTVQINVLHESNDMIEKFIDMYKEIFTLETICCSNGIEDLEGKEVDKLNSKLVSISFNVKKDKKT